MIFDEIKKVISEQLEVEEDKITMDTTFEELGADSLDLFQVVIEIEEKYGIHLHVEQYGSTLNIPDSYFEIKEPFTECIFLGHTRDEVEKKLEKMYGKKH